MWTVIDIPSLGYIAKSADMSIKLWMDGFLHSIFFVLV